MTLRSSAGKEKKLTRDLISTITGFLLVYQLIDTSSLTMPKLGIGEKQSRYDLLLLDDSLGVGFTSIEQLFDGGHRHVRIVQVKFRFREGSDSDCGVWSRHVDCFVAVVVVA